MSEDLVKHYQTEIERLNRTVAELRDEAAKYRTDRSGKLKTALDENETLKKELAKAAKKLEELPKELQGENDRLKGEIRTRDHRAKFNDLAKELKVRPEALNDLWNLSGYKADKDEVDEAAMKAAIEEAVKSRSYLVESEQAAPPVTPPAVKGPAAGKGPRADNVAGSFTQTRAQASDPVFQHANRAAIQAAALQGTLVTV